MNPVIAHRWVEKLLYGGIKQRKFMLGTTDGKRCCLGVLCDIAVEDGVIRPPHTLHEGNDTLYYETVVGQLPETVMEWADMADAGGAYNNAGNALYRDNDHGFSFTEIADIIEAHVEEL